MTQRGFIRRLLIKDCRGIAAVEFALMAPLLVILLTGLIEVSNLLMAERRVVNAAMTAADLIGQELDMDGGDMTDILKSARLVMEPFSDSVMTIGVASVRFDSGLAATVDWTASYNGGSVPNAVSAVSGLEQADQSVIVVRVTYSYTPMLIPILSGVISLSESAFAKPRVVDYVTYTP